MPSMSGQAEVEHDDVGAEPGDQASSACAPVDAVVDLDPARAQVDGERARERGLVVDHEHAGHARHRPSRAGAPASGTDTTIVRPPPGVSSASMRRAHRLGRPRATASPSPTPVPDGASPRRWNASNMRTRSASGTPGPRSTIRSSSRSPATPRVRADGVSGRGVAHGVLDEVRHRAFEQAGVGEDQRGRVAGAIVDRCRAATPRRGALHDLVERGRRQHGSHRPGLQPATGRAGSPAARRGGRPRPRRCRAARRDPRRRATAAGRAGVAMLALMPASGVRRSCDTAASSAVRTASLSRSRTASAARVASRSRSRTAAACAAKASSMRRSEAGSGLPDSASTRPGPASTATAASSTATGGAEPDTSTTGGDLAGTAAPSRTEPRRVIPKVSQRLVEQGATPSSRRSTRRTATRARWPRPGGARPPAPAPRCGRRWSRRCPPTTRNTNEGEHVLRLGDRELVVRRGEEPVGQPAGDERRADGGREPADERGRRRPRAGRPAAPW